jgi:hypothetical protein
MKRDTIIPNVVMKPKRVIGRTSEKQKLRKPIAVVKEVRPTGTPIFFIFCLKNSFLSLINC